jgi:hypothetical protein
MGGANQQSFIVGHGGLFPWLRRRVIPLEHRVGVVRGGRYRLQHVPVLNDLAVSVETEDVDTGGFLASPVQVTHVYKSQIAIDGDAFDLARYAPGLLDVAHDGLEPIREKRVVLNVWPGHETRHQVGLTLIEDFFKDSIEYALDVISGHNLFL